MRRSSCAGAFARVYRGTLDGKPVAVKIAQDVTDSGSLDGTPTEAAIMSALDHQHIVRQVTHALAGAARGRPSYSEQLRAAELRLWMVLEFCDKGSLEVCVFERLCLPLVHMQYSRGQCTRRLTLHAQVWSCICNA